MARLAYALATLRDQIDRKFPTRSKASDGWIGDAAHQARVSQHNPNQWGVVCAIDVTEDLSVGLNCNELMDELDAGNDPRIFYIIHDGMIENSDDTRCPYTGPNKHTKHLHLSVRFEDPHLFDDAGPWKLPMLGTAPARPAKPPVPAKASPAAKLPRLAPGSTGAAVRKLQAFLAGAFPQYRHEHGALPATGNYLTITTAWVKEFQSRVGLSTDGVVGPATNEKLYAHGYRG